ncbi:pentatricopeptide repeat-containing protein 1, mitochondrial-like [Gastrophryne carolinensis]
MLRILLHSLALRYPLHGQSGCRQIPVGHIWNLSKFCHLINQQPAALWTRNYSLINSGNVRLLEEEHFGTLSERNSSRTVFRKSSPDLKNMHYVEDEEDGELKGFQKKFKGRRNSPYWYFLQCKAKIKESKLAEALELFEVKMLLEEQLEPEEYNYTILIGGCGRVGYVKKAFQLYSNMKKRGLKPTDATYTALFNACAESPWKESGLKYAFQLLKELRDKNVRLNLTTYRSVLKAFAMCSYLQTSMEIFKEIVQSGQISSPEAFNILLMGCIKDKKLGFLYALQVWRYMRYFDIKPDIKTYNLLLRATRDCGIGDLKEALNILLHSEHLKHLSSGTSQENEMGTKPNQDCTKAVLNEQLHQCTVSKSHQNTLLNVSSEKLFSKIHMSQAMTDPNDIGSILPNLLDLRINTHTVRMIGNANTPFDRFAMIGGLESVLQKMKEDHVYPTIKTFTLMAEIIKPDMHSEASLLDLMSSLKIKPDLLFLNTLVLKRSEEIGLKSAMEVLPIITQLGIAPNIHTFCNLAKACHKKKDGLQLLQDMAFAGLDPNNHVYSTLINEAIKRLDYIYLTDILRDMKNRNVAPNSIVIGQLEFASQYPPNFDRYQKKNVFLEKIDGFRGYYNRWLEWMDAQETEHPWKQFWPSKENDSETGTQHHTLNKNMFK